MDAYKNQMCLTYSEFSLDELKDRERLIVEGVCLCTEKKNLSSKWNENWLNHNCFIEVNIY